MIGAHLRTSAAMKAFVSAGVPQVQVPDVRGKSADEATNILGDLHLQVKVNTFIAGNRVYQQSPKPGDTVEVHYLGVEFDTGEEFDASWNRGESIEFPLRGLIQGWQDGIPGMKVGGRRRLTIPPDQAYGAQGQPPSIPGNATLVFDIDLKKIG